MSELVPRSVGTIAPIPTDDEINRMYRVAEAVALSKLGKKDQNVGAAYFFTKMLIGRELGLTPGRAISGGLHIFDGNVQMSAVSLGAAIRERGFNYKVTNHTNKSCTITFYDQEGELLGESTFIEEDAKVAKLLTKDNWIKSPKNMYFARAMSNGVKWYIPEAMGGIPVYTEGDDLDEVRRVANLAEGHGDGSDPGWGTVPPDLALKVERTIKRAEKAGYFELGSLTSVKLMLNHAPVETIQGWVRGAELAIANHLHPPDAEVVDGTATEDKEIHSE